MKNAWGSVSPTLRRWLSLATEPHILFPAFALALLGVIWSATWNLIIVERAAAEHAAMTSSRELAETYEAHTARALHEIDQTLKFVKYAYELKGERLALPELKDRALLPPAMLFGISITDARGNIVASTQSSETANVGGQEYFQAQRSGDTFTVGRPQKNPASDKWKLQFSRRLNAADGTFAGIVLAEADAAYFVSSYQSSKLGNHGTLGLVGTDGIFRARRMGESLFAGDAVNYASLVSGQDAEDNNVVLLTNVWDGVPRYTSVRQLHDFPLAVIVGLSEDERLATYHSNVYAYLLRAVGGSILLILVIYVVGRISRQLAQDRENALEEHMAYAGRVEYLAYHDGLTALPNRSLFSKFLQQNISQVRRYKKQLAVLFLDLDRFKYINDTLGHEAGDQLLREVASRLRTCLRDSDIVARLGGDEFVILLPELDDEKYIAVVAQKMLSVIAKPFILLSREFRVTASIGISTYPQDGQDEQTLTKNADIAMYQAKQEGKNNFQFYSEELNANSLERLALESSLRRALENEEFLLHYQAERDIASGQITGMEALLRWQHPDLGTVAPMQFIPLAEETGLIVPIGKWVLKTACAQNVAWQKQGLPHLNMAINMTTGQFLDEHLLQDIAAILKETGMDAHLLELEITEGLLMHDVEKTLRVLTGLRDMGVRIAIDDFGTGYSSLSTLKQFPLDTIKIDRSLAHDANSAPEDRGLTEAIIGMGKSLSLTVIAQGVETKEQADYLRDHSCDEFQGFYFNKPMPAKEFTKVLAEGKKAAAKKV